ncbi:Putative gustatory receptor 28b [Frankliniella fusca]|uniref:Gustatory receptor 28b n=1 Tax=Frankliniella fusca TaxID=407009 RepID=A0AAE1LMM2_9NEOP|nr:Putative gustatory receptor 28b [Frankliniella fusca]
MDYTLLLSISKALLSYLIILGQFAQNIDLP